MLDWAILLIFPACMAFSAASDLFTMTISNRIPLILIASFAILAAFTGMSLYQIGAHTLVAFITLVVTFFFFTRGWMGGGDAKLAAATVLWLGPGLGFHYILLGTVLGGMLTIALLNLRSHAVHPALLYRETWYQHLTHKDTGIPYGIALAGAALLIYPQSRWMALVGLGF